MFIYGAANKPYFIINARAAELQWILYSWMSHTGWNLALKWEVIKQLLSQPQDVAMATVVGD